MNVVRRQTSSELPDIASRRLKSFATDGDMLISVKDADLSSEVSGVDDHGRMRIGVHHDRQFVEAVFARNGPPMHDRDVAEARAALLTLHLFDPAIEKEFNATPKERSYLAMVAQGLNDQEIADKLGLSLRAVRERKKRLISNTGCRTLAHALYRYLEHSEAEPA